MGDQLILELGDLVDLARENVFVFVFFVYQVYDKEPFLGQRVESVNEINVDLTFCEEDCVVEDHEAVGRVSGRYLMHFNLFGLLVVVKCWQIVVMASFNRNYEFYRIILNFLLKIREICIHNLGSFQRAKHI